MLNNINPEGGKVKLDAKDRIILYELDGNARLPASRIAKKAQLSPDAVNYRIRRLLEENVVFKFMTYLDTAKLGYTTYKVFIRLQNTTEEIEAELVRFLVAHNNTQFVSVADGMFDLNVNLLAASADELDSVLGGLNKKFGQYIAERQIMIMVRSDFFSRDYLIGKNRREESEEIHFGSKPEPGEMDGYDLKILALLAVDARMPVIGIAGKVGLGADAVGDRIDKLEKAGIIQSYALVPNTERIGYGFYYILLKFRDLSPQREKAFLQNCKTNPNVWFRSKLIGQWDALLGAEVEDQNAFRTMMMGIKRDFSDIISEYSTLFIPKIYKFNQYPMGSHL